MAVQEKMQEKALVRKFDFKTTFPILSYPGKDCKFTVHSQPELDYHIQNNSASVVGTMTDLSHEQILKRYPRIIQGIVDRGYYSEWEAVRMIRHYRKLRQFNHPVDGNAIEGGIRVARQRRIKNAMT